jgi:hypothetical protein
VPIDVGLPLEEPLEDLEFLERQTVEIYVGEIHRHRPARDMRDLRTSRQRR